VSTLEPLEYLFETLKVMNDTSVNFYQKVEMLAYVVECNYHDKPSGAYIPLIKKIVESKDARCEIRGFSPINLAVGFYIDYARPKTIKIIDVIREYKRDRKVMWRVRTRIRKAVALAEQAGNDS
jgi:hypothetical protein